MPAGAFARAESIPIRAERLPAGIRDLLHALRQVGNHAYLVGGCVRDLSRGAPVKDYDLAVEAPPEAVLAAFPRAVPVGLRHGTVMVPTPAGPVDVTTLRGESLEEDLARRDFSVNAMAWDPASGQLVDPWNGLGDLATRVLRPVGRVGDRFGEDPVRAVRAARLLAQLGFELDPSIEPAMGEARAALAGVARERIRREIEALLLAAAAGAGLALLRRTGIEADLAPGTAEDAAAVVDALPRRLDWRLAGWLRGTNAERTLRRLRFSRARTAAVEQLVRLHPLERGVEPGRPASVRRLLRRTGEDALPGLVALREAELAVSGASRAELDALLAAIARVREEGAVALRRRDLALDGRGVMAALGRGPGPHVGRALEYLTQCVLDDPGCNTRAGLLARLRDWRDQGGAPDAENA